MNHAELIKEAFEMASEFRVRGFDVELKLTPSELCSIALAIYKAMVDEELLRISKERLSTP